MFKIVLEGQTRSSTSVVDMKNCRAAPHPNPAVRWEINMSACVCGRKHIKVAVFTTRKVL